MLPKKNTHTQKKKRGAEDALFKVSIAAGTSFESGCAGVLSVSHFFFCLVVPLHTVNAESIASEEDEEAEEHIR